ncbi:MAG: hypothetical protein R3B06_31895 [Kofleriaceae bacterium]
MASRIDALMASLDDDGDNDGVPAAFDEGGADEGPAAFDEGGAAAVDAGGETRDASGAVAALPDVDVPVERMAEPSADGEFELDGEELSLDEVSVVTEAPAPPAGLPPLPPIRPLPPMRPPVPALRSAPPATPPLPPATPPPAPPPPIAARSTVAEPADAGDDPAEVGEVSDVGIPIELGEDLVSEVSGVVAEPPTPPAAPPPIPVAELPLEHRLESPTVIERALGDLGEAAWEDRATELARRLDLATDREQIADLAYELGELCERRLADEARAVKAYGRALASDPSLRANLWAIRRVFYRRGLWPNLIKLIDAEARFARDDDERADLSIEKGAILADKLAQADDARAALEDAVLLAPGSLPALIALERVADDPARQVEVWAQLAEASHRPERKLVYLLDQVRFWTDQGADLDRARELLEAAMALGVDRARVDAERLRVAELAGDRDELLAALDGAAEHLLARASSTPDAAVSAVTPGQAPGRAAALRLQVVAVRRRQSQVARAAGAGDRAWDYLQAALALAPGEPILLADLADLAEAQGRYDELADLVHSWEAIEGDPSRARALSIRRADALLRAGQREPGLALLASLEATAPGLAPVVALRERDALVTGDPAALAEAWTKAGDAARVGDATGPGGVADPGAAVAAYLAAGQAWLHDVGGERGDAAAVTVLGQARELAPTDPVVVEALVEAHERAGRVDDAAALLREVGTDAAMARLARTYRSAGRVADALAVDRARAERDPTDLALAWRIDSALEVLALDGERLEHLTALADRETEPARRGYARVTAARLAEAAGAVDRAIALYQATLEDWPDDPFARAALEDALRRSARWDELATVRRRHADAMADGAPAAAALREAAWLYEDRLARPADALEVYRQTLDRFPDDAHARAGAVRAALAAGDRAGAAHLLEDAADASVTATLAYAHLRELAGEHDLASDAYQRAEAAAEVGAVAGVQAALAAQASATTRGDTVARIAATRALAVRAADEPRLVAALHEDLGWLYALVLEDFDAAAAAFAEALAAQSSAGAVLGAALVAARRGDRAGLAGACERLAKQIAMPEAAAALYLRAAAIATAAGEHDAAMARVASARAVAPDDVGALLVAAEQQVAATPPGPGEDVASAVDRLLARAEILAMRTTLADDPAARDGWELDRAEALEAAGRLREAGAAVVAVVRGNPKDVRALEALVRLAARGGDRATEARAAVALAELTASAQGKRELYARAAAIFDGDGADPAAAVAVYRRMLVLEPGAAEFEPLMRHLRAAADTRSLVEVLSDRLAWLATSEEDPITAVPLLSERAALRRKVGDVRGAADDLDVLLDRAPAVRDALRRRAELAGELGEAASAAGLWRRYLAVETEPAARAEAELLLARTLAEDLGDVGAAIEQVESVIVQRPSDPLLRERLVGLATQAGDWARVVRELRELARLRPNPLERAREELRLGRVARDQLRDPGEALAAFARGRELDPLSLELLREQVELAASHTPQAKSELLARGVADLRRAIDANPASVTLYDRLATATAWQGDRDGQWLALVALESLGAPGPEQRSLIAAGRERAVPAPSRQLLDRAARAALRADGADGVAGELWRAIAPAVNGALALEPGKLGFGRGDRVAQKALGKKHDALAAALSSFGIDDVELYVSDARPGLARVLSAATPIICCGADVAAGASALARFMLGRAVATAADGTAALAELKDAEVAWFVVAALRVAGVPVPAAVAAAVAGDEAAIAERTRLVDKHIARRDKKAVAALAPRLGELPDLTRWRAAMVASTQRAGLLWSGDLGVALGAIDVGRGGRHLDPVALDLVRWSVSAVHAELRAARQLVAPGGAR